MPLDLVQFQRDFAAALGAPARGAIAVYRNAVVHGAVEALRANFPVVAQIVGPEMFQAISVDFASECPPRRPVMALYGERFADWLAAQEWIADIPYLADVARVERLRIESLMASDALPLSAEELGNANFARLTLHPALRFGWLSTPAMSIWLAHQRSFASPLTPEWKAEGALFARPTAYVMHSPRIGRAAHRILFGIRLSETVAQAMAAASRLYPDEDCPALLSSLVNLGAFVAPAERNLA
ncbi:HvfC/BufC N-terminal domain-containing protein [Sphingomonas hankyongi]|uniref:DNA-binding domain-containing protein n=1 Tax=Sphingomonas hankyongi TaxID=2908209 RepID=A0ABT0S1Y0_9SPHN|nr:DNA-binding domain-containing protein [Sphingomonas hankyongi]MCL6729761.1 DNA-binding domain-containing protein [Sphingomonas hankyongi]